jgi:hypothetical protein
MSLSSTPQKVGNLDTPAKSAVWGICVSRMAKSGLVSMYAGLDGWLRVAMRELDLSERRLALVCAECRSSGESGEMPMLAGRMTTRTAIDDRKRVDQQRQW